MRSARLIIQVFFYFMGYFTGIVLIRFGFGGVIKGCMVTTSSEDVDGMIERMNREGPSG